MRRGRENDRRRPIYVAPASSSRFTSSEFGSHGTLDEIAREFQACLQTEEIMTKAQALRRFRFEVAPAVVARHGSNDKPACRQAWNNWTDSLHKDGEITTRQYEDWTGPKSCGVRRLRKRA